MPASARLINRWWQLLACMIAMVAIANLQYTWTLFTVPLSAGLRAKLSEVQLAFTLFILTQSWLVPAEGYLVDRLGARIVVAVGGLLAGLSWAAPVWRSRCAPCMHGMSSEASASDPCTAPAWAPC
jgi:MFS family permease